MTHLQALSLAKARLSQAGFCSAEAEAQQLVSACRELSPPTLWLQRHRLLPPEAEEQLHSWLIRREHGEPLQLILGTSVFFGLTLKVRPGVLIPRPETEGLVTLALALLARWSQPRVLDVGSGSGAIALAIKYAHPKAELTATEIDMKALSLARSNADELGLSVHWRHAAFTAGLSDVHMVVANPPYLPLCLRAAAPTELSWENPAALYAGEDGLAVARPLAHQALNALLPGGWLVLELDPANIHILAGELPALGYLPAHIHSDLTGKDRYLAAQKIPESALR